MNLLKLVLALSLIIGVGWTQTSDAPTGRTHPLVLTVSGNTGAHGASTVFTAPTTGLYLVHWSMRTTVVATAGTLSGLTLAWNNGNTISRNSLLIGPQLLDLASLTSTGLTSAEITGVQPMYVVSGTSVTWATVVGTAIVGSPQYTVEFRVFAAN
jgi:hypothetical protein